MTTITPSRGKIEDSAGDQLTGVHSVIVQGYSSTERSGLTVERVDVSAFTIPTDGPDGEESDGTFTWSSTTLTVVEVHAGDATGLGYTYADQTLAHLIQSNLANTLIGKDPADQDQDFPPS